MSDLTLINVYLAVNRDGRFDWMPPLGCLYLVSVLEEASIDVHFKDYQTYADTVDDPMNPDVLADFAEPCSPVVAFSCMFNLLPLVVLAAQRIKTRNPDVKIMLGGPGPSGVARELLTAAPWIDIVASGEGEITIVEAMRCLRDGNSCKGVAGTTFRMGENIISNPPRPLIRDIDTIPLPAYTTVDLSKYTVAAIMTLRGCGIGCTFCDVSPYWGNVARFRSLDKIQEELNVLNRVSPGKRLMVQDDTFTFNQKRMDRLCQILSSRSSWICLMRADHVTEELCKKLATAGCEGVLIGIESGSDRVLKLIKKGITSDQAARAIPVAVKYFKYVVCTFMWGFPFETTADFEETALMIAYAYSCGAKCQISLVSPMPYSLMFKTYRNQLAFSRDLISNMVTCRYWNFKRRQFVEGMNDEMLYLIENNLDAFPGFCYYNSLDFVDKVEQVTRMGMDVSLG
jgi:radical SAM superfamily enzyme YgiQ (UPF0313 family)